VNGTLRAAQRHAAREAALQMLYQWEVGGTDLGEVLASYPSIGRPPLDDAARAFAERLVRGTAVGLAQIDPMIAEQAQHWRLERMPVIDRLILRLAIFELLEATAPLPVIIDEAVTLARTFSTEPAVGFVNGMLDAIGRRLRADDRTAATTRRRE
jgi:N utilization substance protein B